MKTVSHTAKVKTDLERVKEQILILLDGTSEQYNKFQYDMGIKFLELETEGVEADVSRISNSQLFWGWWKNQWYARDQYFLHISAALCPDTLAIKYQHHNNPDTICFHTNILQASYANMIGKLIKTEVNNG